VIELAACNRCSKTFPVSQADLQLLWLPALGELVIDIYGCLSAIWRKQCSWSPSNSNSTKQQQEQQLLNNSGSTSSGAAGLAGQALYD
jgi:hypothetical protein